MSLAWVIADMVTAPAAPPAAPPVALASTTATARPVERPACVAALAPMRVSAGSTARVAREPTRPPAPPAAAATHTWPQSMLVRRPGLPWPWMIWAYCAPATTPPMETEPMMVARMASAMWGNRSMKAAARWNRNARVSRRAVVAATSAATRSLAAFIGTVVSMSRLASRTAPIPMTMYCSSSIELAES
ncbi:hypothetical protein OIE68_09315 [Nocardia vinacea]|uniref:hypothetical protein n=1 Tax=Nocardia vinacea TaxID=96468 RepID=UPI002E0F760A|nr:hypothetical protein OIE68_09315 [Nocardia vinacea]